MIYSKSGFKTKREAILEATEIERKLFQGSFFISKKTLYELWQSWYHLLIESSDLTKETKEKYRRRGNLIKEHFGNKRAMDIKPSLYQAFINDYGKRVTRNEVSRINGDIRRTIAAARRDGMLLLDFTEGVQLVGAKYKKATEDKYLSSVEDYQRVLQELKSRFDYKETITPYLLYFLFKTGLRVGEAMATTWEDLDFEENIGYTYRRFAGDRQEFCPPKTATSIRYYPLSDEVVRVLKNLKRVQKMFLEERMIENKENLVFFDWKTGVPTNSAMNKYLKSCLSSLDISTQMTATGTRHTYGSYLLSQGVDIWVVSKILGHKDIKQLIETYGHLLKEKQKNEFKEVRLLVDKQSQS